MYPGVEHRLLRYVIAVAEELHFSRAADKLHVSQPSLSKQIKELEASLGIALFERTKRAVRITEAGEIFVQEARQALLHGERAVNLAQSAHRSGAFSLGYSLYVSHDFISTIRRLFASQFPKTQFSLMGAFADEQMESIRTGALDAGLFTLPISVGTLAVQRLHKESLWVVIPQRHRLARVHAVRLRELGRMPMIVLAKRLCPQLHDRIHQAFARENSMPRLGQEVMTPAEAIPMVVGGLGFALIRECDHQFRHPGVLFKRIEGQPLILESGIVYRPDGGSPIIPALIAALQQRKEPGVASPIAAGLTA